MNVFVFLLAIIVTTLGDVQFYQEHITPIYGNSNSGDRFMHFSTSEQNGNRIKGINKWGNAHYIQYNNDGTGIPYIRFEGNIVIKSWSTDMKRDNNEAIGWAPLGYQRCESFTLNDTDYIDGYRILSNHYIAGIQFKTYFGNIYSCLPKSDKYIMNNELNDTGWIIYHNMYLSGIYGQKGAVIDGIGFQFTPIQYHANKLGSHKDTTHTNNANDTCYIGLSLWTCVYLIKYGIIGYYLGVNGLNSCWYAFTDDFDKKITSKGIQYNDIYTILEKIDTNILSLFFRFIIGFCFYMLSPIYMKFINPFIISMFIHEIIVKKVFLCNYFHEYIYSKYLGLFLKKYAHWAFISFKIILFLILYIIVSFIDPLFSCL